MSKMTKQSSTNVDNAVDSKVIRHDDGEEREQSLRAESWKDVNIFKFPVEAVIAGSMY